MLCNEEKTLENEAKTAKLAKNLGLDVTMLNAEEVQAMEPNIKMNAVGAAFYKCDYHTTPHEFMNEMKHHLKKVGVTFFTNEKVLDLNIKKSKILAVKTTKKTLKADEFVLTTGAWISQLSKKLGLKLLMQAGKGYRINSPKTTNINYPAILVEKKVAVTPMNGFTRFAGTMEIAGINTEINKIRVDAIAEGAKKYYPELVITDKEKEDVACGLRPVTPDGLPYIGKTSKSPNLTIAAGHAMMGWSMATATGKLVSEAITEKPFSLNISPFNPERKF